MSMSMSMSCNLSTGLLTQARLLRPEQHEDFRALHLRSKSASYPCVPMQRPTLYCILLMKRQPLMPRHAN